MDLELRGKTVLVTGASKGIGLACALAFAAEGAARVHIASRTEADLKAAASAIRAKHKTEVVIHALDLGHSADQLTLAQRCADIDILVNNAGAIPSGGILDVNEERWRTAWDLKVFGFINLTREVYRRMKERRSGVIINIIGMAGERHRPDYIAGTAGNAALMAFTRGVGGESTDYGVRAVGVNPGRIETERQITHMKERAERELGDASRWTEIQTKVSATLPFKRAGQPSEVGDLVAFLASPRAAYISGTIVSIDGGASLRARA